MRARIWIGKRSVKGRCHKSLTSIRARIWIGKRTSRIRLCGIEPALSAQIARAFYPATSRRGDAAYIRRSSSASSAILSMTKSAISL